MSDTARAVGVGVAVEFDGRSYEISEMTVEQLGRYSAWLEECAWNALGRAKRHLSPDDYRSALDGLTASIAAQEYEPFSPVFLKSLGTLSGLKEALYLSLRDKDKTVTRELIDRMCKERLQDIANAVQKVNAPLPPEATGNEAPPPAAA